MFLLLSWLVAVLCVIVSVEQNSTDTLMPCAWLLSFTVCPRLQEHYALLRVTVFVSTFPFPPHVVIAQFDHSASAIPSRIYM